MKLPSILPHHILLMCLTIGCFGQGIAIDPELTRVRIVKKPSIHVEKSINYSWKLSGSQEEFYVEIYRLTNVGEWNINLAQKETAGRSEISITDIINIVSKSTKHFLIENKHASFAFLSLSSTVSSELEDQLLNNIKSQLPKISGHVGSKSREFHGVAVDALRSTLEALNMEELFKSSGFIIKSAGIDEYIQFSEEVVGRKWTELESMNRLGIDKPIKCILFF